MNLVKFVLLAYRSVDGYCTMYDLYMGVISPATLKEKIEKGSESLADELAAAGSWLTIGI